MRYLSFFVLILIAFDAQAEPEYDRSLSLDTQYFSIDENEFVPSNRALGDFSVEFLNTNALLFDWVGETVGASQSPWARLPYFLLFEGVLFTYVQEPLGLAYHEFGHASRLRALGARPLYNYNNSSRKYHNFFSFFLAGVGEEVDGGQAIPGGTVFNLDDPEYDIEGPLGELDNPIYLMGGLNNEMLLTEKLEEQMYYGDGHIMEFPTYVASKRAAAFYIEDLGSVGDVANINNYYTNTKSYNIGNTEVSRASDLALLLSSSTYAYMYGLYTFVKDNDPVVKHFEYKGIKIPDVSFYMTRRGLSYKLNTGYKLHEKKTWILFAYEKVYEGDDANEVTVGYRRETSLKGKNIRGTLNAIFGPKISAELKLGMEVAPRLWVNFGSSLYNVRSLWGERNIPSLENGDQFSDIWLKASYLY